METTTPFSDFELHKALLDSLNTFGFTKASPIQEMTLSHILLGKDVFAQAETGSGKTGSFVIPILEKILREETEQNKSNQGEELQTEKLVQYVTLSPTRELAQQTHKVFTELGKELGVNAACLIGGESIDKQKNVLSKGTRVLVATPGRLVDLIKQKAVKLDQVKAVVFDEADRLFDMGFQKDIEFILSKVSSERQLIMVSATSNMEVLKTCYKFKSHPLELKLNEDSLLVENINHSLAMVTQNEKMPLLVNLLKKNEDVYAIVFCNTQIQTHRVAEWLRLMDFKAKPISGRLPQNKRSRLMEEFRAKKVTILVCTDVAARGLDIKDVNLVINFDLPQEAANYVHRIGRTGRAGKSGQAISFCAHEDCEFLDPIYSFIDGKIEKLNLSNDDVTYENLPPKPYIDGKTLKVVEKSGDRKKSRSSRNSRKEELANKNKEKTNHTKKNSNERGGDLNEKYDAPLERALPTPLKKFVSSEEDQNDRRFFTITSDSLENSNRAALGYYMINDESLLKHEIIKKGPKRYFFFGPRRNTYKFSLEANYEGLLRPFLREILHLCHLELTFDIKFSGTSVDISFDGDEVGLLLRNRGELTQSLEQLCRLYLANKITLPPRLRWNLIAGGHSANKKRSSSKPNQEKDRRPPNRQRRDQNRRGHYKSKEEREKEYKEREEKIISLAKEAKDKVLATKEPFTLKALDPRDRRTVHQFLHDDSEVKTTSLGEGRLKKIEISIR